MLIDLLKSSYFSLFLIVALGFMLGRIKIKGLSLDVSAVIFIALLFGHFGVIIPKELGRSSLKVPWNNPILAKDSTYPIQEEWNISNAM